MVSGIPRDVDAAFIHGVDRGGIDLLAWFRSPRPARSSGWDGSSCNIRTSPEVIRRMILVDASIWIDHRHATERALG